MNNLDFLLSLAIILLSTKLLGILMKRFQLPQVIGALVAGLLLGPAIFNILHDTDFIHKIAEIGVIVLMFGAGVETDINDLKKSGKSGFIIALIGVIVPIIGGFIISSLFFKPVGINSGKIILQNIFIGVVLSATSVSITVETLKDIGKLSTKAGNAILSAAIIDDIIGIIALTLITSFTGESVNVTFVLLKIAAFFVFVTVVGFLFYKLYQKWIDYYKKDMRRFIIAAFVFCLLMSYSADKYFGVADITGAYFAGLVISCTGVREFVARRFDIMSYMIFSPVFFASIGLKVTLPKLSGDIIAFSIALTIIAVLTKVIGCGLGAKLCKYNKQDCIRIGVGMISRGEVALIVINKGVAMNLMQSDMLAPIMILVIITTIITPILLKLVFTDDSPADENMDTPITKSVSALLELNKKE